MRAQRNWRLALAACLAFPYVAAFAQQITIPELVRGEKLPATIKASDLPDGFKAVRLKVAGESGISDLYSGPLGMLMMVGGGMRGNGNEAAQAELVDFIELSWTKGEIVHLLSTDAAAADAVGSAKPSREDEYLVTYKANLGLAQLMALSTGAKPAPTELKLALVKVSSISAITPEPTMTKDRLVAALSSAASVLSSSRTTAMDTAVTPVADTAAPAVPGPPASSEQSAAVSNGKQIALGVIMYATDNDDVLPYVQSVVTVKEVTMPYLRNANVWQTTNPASQWRFNMCLGGVSCTAIEAPASTPMFYESAPWSDGRRVVAFVDGHVRLVSGSDWTAMAKYLKLKLKRMAKKPLPLHLSSYSGAPPPMPGPAKAPDAGAGD